MRVPTLVKLVPVVVWLLRAVPVAAFCEEAGPFCVSNPDVCETLGVPRCHREITEEGLAFMRPHVLERTVHTNLHMDHSHIDTLWSHTDGCDFLTTGRNVNDIYSSDVHSNFFLGLCVPTHCTLPHEDTWGVTGLFDPTNPRPVDAAAVLGYALHPIQDLYSHSNWVEIFRDGGVSNPPLVEGSVDLWTLQPWQPLDVDPAFLAQPGIDADAVMLADQDGYGDDWVTSDVNFPPYNVPRILAGSGGPVYIGVISGSTHGSLFQGEECPPVLTQSHTNLNKDSTKMTTQFHGAGPEDHYTAARLATRQTAHEWCRLLHLARDHWGFAGVSVPMAFWVDPHAPAKGPGSPHPDGTPCEASESGPIEITVDVDQIRVLNDTDDDDAGELNFALALYTHDLTRSGRAEVNSIILNSGESLDDAAAPGPVTLCVTEAQANAAAATVQAWDDDFVITCTGTPPNLDCTVNPGVPGELNPDTDQALRGVHAEVGLNALGVHTVSSPSMEVTFDVQRTSTDGDGDGLFACDEETRGTDPGDSDSDDDGVDDGTEVGLGTNPLDGDSDDDGLDDGTEVGLGTNPLDGDSDDDGLTDGGEVAAGTDPLDADTDDDGLLDGEEGTYGTDPLDADTDDDQLLDGLEVQYGTGPLDPDSDDDGLLDGEDVEWLQNAVRGLSLAVFRSPAAGNRTAMLAMLDDIEVELLANDRKTALRKLRNLRGRVDGCGSAADKNDWILACPVQIQVRGFVDLLIANLSP